MLNIYHSAADAPEFLPLNSLVCDKYENVLSKIKDESVDFVCIDPPYTDGKTDALPNHKIQTKISIPHVIQESYRVLKPDGFFVFFGQMPTILSWLNAAQNMFKYRDKIAWIKRMITSPYLDIQRSHEDILIYAKGKPKYWETQEKYEDLKTPGISLGLHELSTIKTTISDLQRRVKHNGYNLIYFQGMNVDNSPVPLPQSVPNENGFAQSVFDELDKLQREIRPLSDKCNDAVMHDAFQKTLERRGLDFDNLDKAQKLDIGHGKANDQWLENKLPNAAKERAAQFDENRDKGKQIGYQDPASNDKSWNKGRQLKTAHRYRSKHWCNVTNSWSFLPEPEDFAAALISTAWSYLGQNQTAFGAEGENWKHPTVKPVKLLKRLIKLLTPEPEQVGYIPVVLDFFAGTGTSTKAAAELGRNFIGVELQPDYFAMTVARTRGALNGEKVLSKDITPAPNTQSQSPVQTKLF